MTLRTMLPAFWLGFAVASHGQGGSVPGFQFDDVRQLAAERAAAPYVDRKTDLAPFWAGLAAEDYQKIQPRREAALWAAPDSPFSLLFAHPGGPLPRTVVISEIASATASEIFWKPECFDYGSLKIPADAASPGGFAGFQILAPVNDPSHRDELLSFAGGSFFRAVAPGLHYGLAARGLALNTALPKGEEFPQFERFWIERPGVNAKSLVCYALLDTPSAAGAYRFRTTPGRSTVMEVDAEVIFRQEVERIGFAPFSSMFWHGEISPQPPTDFRPEVHDSDGLLVQFGDSEVLWRPLDNGRAVRHSVLNAEKLLGFGLIQRDRGFDHYQDLKAAYEQRPSAWVEPFGTWPTGKIHLVELPTGEATWGNVVCFWEPDKRPQPGQRFRISYRIHWLPEMSIPGVCKVLSTRRAITASADPAKPGEEHEYVVDFSPIMSASAEAQMPAVYAEAGLQARLLDRSVSKNPHTGGWRAVIRVHIPASADNVEMSCRLLSGGRQTSEKWSYLWKKQP
ncbi:MAG: glucan biosynthesis protein G [Verrucomicrobiales bacterium]|nr:glucan biosynthesis protein G [Verrucomicrobiales bacterium]